MQKLRRVFIKKLFVLTGYSLSAIASLTYAPASLAKRIAANYRSNDYETLLQDLFADSELKESSKIKFKRLPKTAENGAVVPIKIITSLEQVEKIFILVEKNPHPLIAEFILSEPMIPEVSARIKMAESSDVLVVIKTKQHYYKKSQFVKVTVGGCG